MVKMVNADGLDEGTDWVFLPILSALFHLTCQPQIGKLASRTPTVRF